MKAAESNDPKIREAAEDALSVFRIALFYFENDDKSEALAKKIKDKLSKQRGYKKRIVLNPSNVRTMKSVNYQNNGNQIRYEPGKEDEAKNVLKTFLDANFPNEVFKDRALTNFQSKNYISIFLEKNGI